MQQLFFHYRNLMSVASDENLLPPLYQSVQAFGVEDLFCLNTPNINLNEITSFLNTHRGEWIFFFLSYDMVSSFAPVTPHLQDVSMFPYVVLCTASHVEVNKEPLYVGQGDIVVSAPVQHTSKAEYIAGFDKIMQHIREGDIYEMNYCIPFSADVQAMNAYTFWQRLCAKQPMPMSMFFEWGDWACMSASPERFFQKREAVIFSQPMKGTQKRIDGLDEKAEKERLFNSEKDRTENVMTVDVTRNDLSKISIPGSVKVDELFGVYTFRYWYQLISTVSAQLKQDIDFIDIMKALFPMASMTGAPKIRAMQIIHEYEPFSRGPYSGTIGFIDPKGNIDANVLIRSVFLNKALQKIFFWSGGAITEASQAEDEYNECLLKSTAIIDMLKSYIHELS